ncbi:MAG: futalosine hydrolase [Candidatus Zixiibacteriota bacterium]|nr:MAG: futalosine hydrolase [candidate division Zixibacteria bacterium]
MKKLIVSATEKEVQPLLEKAKRETDCLFSLTNEIDILITGVGVVQTTFNLMHHLEKNRYDQLINVGIAGGFSPSLAIGTVVEVIADTFGDFGVDDNGQFIPAGDVGLMEKDEFPFTGGWLKNSEPFDVSLPQVKGITVQTTSGSTSQIEERKKIFNPDIETMESAAFFFVALQKKIPFSAIRAISNKVEPRNKRDWDIELAASNLTRYLEKKI